MLVAVYWAWNYTTWMTNWFDPDTVPVRLVLVFVMAGEPADGGRDPGGIRGVRAAVRVRLLGSADRAQRVRRRGHARAVGSTRTSARSWPGACSLRRSGSRAASSTPKGCAGSLWLGALGLDLAGPLVTYWLPGFGRTPMSQWQIEGAHFGERFQLFVIIALGESIVLAGATASDTGLSVEVVAALLLAFLSSTALWWLYFGQVAGTVLERIRAATARGAGPDRPRHLHLPAPPDRRRDRARRGRRRARDRASDGRPARRGSARRARRPRALPRRPDGLRRQDRPGAEPRREPSPSSRCSPPCRSLPAPTGCSSRHCSQRSWRCWSWPSSCATGRPDGGVVLAANHAGVVRARERAGFLHNARAQLARR